MPYQEKKENIDDNKEMIIYYVDPNFSNKKSKTEQKKTTYKSQIVATLRFNVQAPLSTSRHLKNNNMKKNMS